MKLLFGLLLVVVPIFAFNEVHKNLSLEKAIILLKKNNLEINVAKFDEKIRSFEHEIAIGYNYGKLDLTQVVMRSNDAGNVFGFKLQSRKATFGDFGAKEFMNNFISGNPDYVTPPKNLNYPEAITHFQTKLSYSLPLYTGGKLKQYEKITKALEKMSKLDTKKIISEKIYQLKKSYYDIYLLNIYIKNLEIIKKNMFKLENMAKGMIKEGYAKKVDLLEVQSKKANIIRMINQAKVNKKLVYHFLSFLLNSKVESISGNYSKVKFKTQDINKVLNQNLDIKKIKQGLAVTNMAVDLQKSNNLPNIGAFVEYGSSDDTFLGNFAKHDAYTFGVQFKLNIFNGGVNNKNIEKARLEYLKVLSKVDLVNNGIILQIKEITTKIKSLDFDIKSLQKEIELTRTIYKNYLGRYQEKIVSINDVIIKQSFEIEKVLKLNEVQNSRTRKILELEKIVNGEEI